MRTVRSTYFDSVAISRDQLRDAYKDSFCPPWGVFDDADDEVMAGATSETNE